MLYKAIIIQALSINIPQVAGVFWQTQYLCTKTFAAWTFSIKNQPSKMAFKTWLVAAIIDVCICVELQLFKNVFTSTGWNKLGPGQFYFSSYFFKSCPILFLLFDVWLWANLDLNCIYPTSFVNISCPTGCPLKNCLFFQ